MSDSNITKLALVASFKKVLEKKPFHMVRISDIVEGCHLERQTFYYHFNDKYDLVVWIFKHDIEKKPSFTSSSITKEDIKEICEYFLENREYYHNVFLNGEKMILRNLFYTSMYEKFYRIIPEDGDDVEFRKTASEFYALGMVGLLIRWTMNDMGMDLNTLSNHFYKLFQVL